MKCPRCGSVMVYEIFYGPNGNFWGWRCIFCGEILDDVILENRHWTKTGGQNMERRKEFGNKMSMKIEKND
jgi:uncharacterized C2H2 Zn-finger protein